MADQNSAAIQPLTTPVRRPRGLPGVTTVDLLTLEP